MYVLLYYKFIHDSSSLCQDPHRPFFDSVYCALVVQDVAEFHMCFACGRNDGRQSRGRADFQRTTRDQTLISVKKLCATLLLCGNPNIPLNDMYILF